MGYQTLPHSQHCVLEKAMDCEGVIRRAGGYSGDKTSALRMGFADASAVDELIVEGMLACGEYFNVYVVTDKGREYALKNGMKSAKKSRKKPRAN